MPPTETETEPKPVPKQFRKRKTPWVSDDKKPPAREARPKLPDVPLPPAATMGYNSDFPSKQFFDYWQGIEKTFPGRLIAYVYRYWPVIDRERTQQHVSKGDRIINIGKHVVPFRDEIELYHRYGAGDYEVKLNDPGRSGGSLCRLYLRGFRDMNTYQPDLDLRELVQEDPVNRPYIQWAKSKGILKDDSELGEDDDMGQATAVEKLTDALQEQTGQIVEVSERRAEAAEAELRALRDKKPESAAPSVEQVAGIKAMEMMADGFRSTIQQVTASQNPAAPMQMFKEVVAAARELVGTPAPVPAQANQSGIDLGALLRMFMERETSLQAQIMQLNQTQIEALKSRMETTTVANPAIPQDPLSQVRSIYSFVEEIRGKTTPAPSGDEPAASFAAGFDWNVIPRALQALVGLYAVHASARYNEAVMQTGGKAKLMEVPATAAIEAVPEPSVAMPGQAASAENPMAQYHQLLQIIGPPMLGMMMDSERETPGADFADWLMEWRGGGPQGRQFYETLTAHGPDMMVTLLKSYPPLWSQLEPIQEKLKAFLDQFFQHDEIRQKEFEQEPETEDPTPVRKVRTMPTDQPPAA